MNVKGWGDSELGRKFRIGVEVWKSGWRFMVGVMKYMYMCMQNWSNKNSTDWQ